MMSLWRRTPKRKVRVKGVTISFLSLPPSKVLVWDGQRMQPVPAFSLVHFPTKTAMVFVANSEPSWRLRYTVFHEWHETQSHLGGQARAERKTLRDMFRAIERLGNSHPDLPDLFREAILYGRSPVHLAAMAAELRLAQKEMSPSMFAEFVQEARRNRI